MKVRRAQLMFPINISRFVEKAWTRTTDAIALDLEDAVPPAEKTTARALVKETIPIVARGGAEVSVRINKPLFKEDIEACIWPGFDFLIFPKAESADEMREVDRLITRLERERNIPEGTVEIVPLIENAKGIKNAYEIASASPRIRFFGSAAPGDTIISLGMPWGIKDRDLLAYANVETQWVARALGLGQGRPFLRGIHELTFNTTEDIFLEKLAVARKLGFRSASAIHPSQAKAYVKGYTPTDEEVQEAKAIVEAFRKAFAKGEVCTELEGRIIDNYLAQKAQEVIDYAKACAERDAEKARAVKKASIEYQKK